MPFIPHTEDETRSMLETIGVEALDDLFDEIPANLRAGLLDAMPPALDEMGVQRLMSDRAAEDGDPLCFIGAGAYDHHIPAAVWELVGRGEFYTAYTPYQAEASQGTLQLLYEYQSMMAKLTATDISNASLYDGASALAEAVLMAVRANRKSKSGKVLVPRSLHPAYRKVVRTLVGNQGIQLIELPYDESGGHTSIDALSEYQGEDYAALVIPQPNFFGILEDVDALADWAHANGTLAIGVVNPVAMALLKPAGEWGEKGADIVCGEGQPLGIPLASGGPYFGFLCCKQPLARQMPGRIVGSTVDKEGKRGYTLTLQAREQHIRRSKATSNICTNQGLMVTAATIYMALRGDDGLRQTALASHRTASKLVERLTELAGVEAVFDHPLFHEAVIRLDRPVDEVLRSLAAQNLLGGYALGHEYPELENCLLVCATETKTQADIDSYVGHMERILSKQQGLPCRQTSS